MLISDEGQRLAQQAKVIYDEIPEEARRSQYKTGVREYMKQYLRQNGIEDV